jgi:hypothetical protein
VVLHQLERSIGDHLVDVHVRGGARAALEHIELELIVEFSVDHLLACPLDSSQDRLVELPALEVRTCGGALHHGQRLDQIGIQVELNAGDVEILEARAV